MSIEASHFILCVKQLAQTYNTEKPKPLIIASWCGELKTAVVNQLADILFQWDVIKLTAGCDLP